MDPCLSMVLQYSRGQSNLTNFISRYGIFFLGKITPDVNSDGSKTSKNEVIIISHAFLGPAKFFGHFNRVEFLIKDGDCPLRDSPMHLLPLFIAQAAALPSEK